MFCKKETKKSYRRALELFRHRYQCRCGLPGKKIRFPPILATKWHARSGVIFSRLLARPRLSSELPEAGSFLTNSDLGKPILMTRDEQGRFRAFLNVCRHRGAILEEKERGRRRLFSCPFHGWGYSSAGGLISVPKKKINLAT